MGASPVLAASDGDEAQMGEAAPAGESAGAASNIVERLLVVGSRSQVERIPGSVQILDEAELQEFQYEDIHRILRQVPGVNIQEEEGYGLRPNIGLRGTGLARSSKITLMEDGVLIAPAPYAAPSAYYFPVSARMEAVEVRKGSSAIKFGPRTVGGAINLVSTSIPDDWGGRVEGRIGSDDFRQMYLRGGGSTDMFGFMVETYQSETNGFKKLDGGGDTGFDIEDYVAKARINTPSSTDTYQALELKVGYYDERSNETYLGLTDADFAETPYRRYAASQRDQMNAEHKQFQATHYIELGESIDLTTVGYYNDFYRNWFKLDSVNRPEESVGISSIFDAPQENADLLAILRGEVNSADDALSLRNNARDYYSWGVQSVLGAAFETGAAAHEFEFGVRYHEDEEDRLQHEEHFRMDNGALVPTSVDPLGAQANREAKADAWAVYAQDRIELGRWAVTPGVRYENIDLVRLDYLTSDPDRTQGPDRVREHDLDVFIPGVGVTYTVSDRLSVLGGVHKGFSPPGPGTTEARAEKSTNVEFGFRYDRNGVNVTAIGFYNDYSNLLGTCTNAAGCTGAEIGDQFNAGKVDVLGLELSGGANLGAVGDVIVATPIEFSYTLTDTEFQTSFDNSFWGSVTEGDKLPYIPKHQLYASIGVEGVAWRLNLTANIVSKTRDEASQGPVAATNKVDGRAVFDLSGDYNLTESVRLFASVHNVFDKAYSVARRPAGLRPGKPRTVLGGLDVAF